jgi:hypothetical protein
MRQGPYRNVPAQTPAGTAQKMAGIGLLPLLRIIKAFMI